MSVAKIIELSVESPKSFEVHSERDHQGIQDRAQHQIGLGEGATPGDRQRQGRLVSRRPEGDVRAGLTSHGASRVLTGC